MMHKLYAYNIVSNSQLQLQWIKIKIPQDNEGGQIKYSRRLFEQGQG
jgi:hypothetical protein